MQTSHQLLTDVAKLKRNDVVPYYIDLIEKTQHDSGGEEVVRINNLILSKWTNAGLIYIKEKAWKSLKVIL